MQTAPARGRLTKEKSDVRDNVFSSKSLSCPQQKSHAAQRLNRLTSEIDALCVWKKDIEQRIADVDARLWEPNWFFSRVYQDEVDDLAGAVRAWKLAAAGVVLELNGADDMRRTS